MLRGTKKDDVVCIVMNILIYESGERLCRINYTARLIPEMFPGKKAKIKKKTAVTQLSQKDDSNRIIPVQYFNVSHCARLSASAEGGTR